MAAPFTQGLPVGRARRVGSGYLLAMPSARPPIVARLSTVLLAASIASASPGCGPGKGVVAPKRPAPPIGAVTTPAIEDVPLTAEVATADAAAAVSSTVKEVTVYSDRARLTRVATAEVGAEPRVLAFRKLPGWVDDGTVRVASSAGRILDVRVERSFLARPTDPAWRRAEAAHKLLQAQVVALDDEVAVLAAQQAQIEGIRAFSLEKINKDAVLGDVKVTTYADVVEFISASLRKTAAERREVQRKRELLAPELEASTRTLADLKRVMALEETTVLVTVQAAAPASTTLELTYMMPGATWQPMHELRAGTQDASRVEVVSYAVVTQTSGEDWGQAELSFSTQSSVEAVRIPELEALTLGETHTATRTQTTIMSSSSRASQAYSSQNELWNSVQQSERSESDRRRFEEVYRKNFQTFEVVQSKTVRLFEGLQRRGTTAHFKASAAPRVRGDGHPVRIRIGRSELPATQRLVAVPAQTLNVARTLELVNGGGQALLPGEVALYQDGVFLGMTEVDFIAASEKFSLFLSVADHLKLSRTLDRKRSSIVRRRTHRLAVEFVITIENLDDAPATVTLSDRIPVSENRDIRIDKVRITPEAKPDGQGLLSWPLTLAAGARREFRISYEVEYPPSLILETRRRRSDEPANPSRSKDINEQLLDLEDSF